MPLTLARNQLRSRVVRNTITNDTGIRQIGRPQEGRNLPRLLEKLAGGLFDGLIQATNWIIDKLGSALKFTATGIYGAFVGAVIFIDNFNWNITDEALDEQLKSLRLGLTSQLGTAAGALSAAIVCGLAPGVVAFKFNEALGVEILQRVGEEALEELASNMEALAKSAFKVIAAHFLASAFKSLRHAVKTSLKQNDLFGRAIKSLLGNKTAEALKTWGEPGGEEFILSERREERISNINNDYRRVFDESFADEFGDRCIDYGYIVAGGIDDYLLKRRVANSNNQGSQETVEIIPDRQASNERIYLSGTIAQLRPTITQTLTTHQLLYNRDVGQYVGYPVEEESRREPSRLMVKIQFYSRKTPPFRPIQPDGTGLKRTTITIPYFERNKLDWQKIKTACGGNNGYNWGRFKASCLTDKNATVTLYGGSASEAEERLEALMALSEAEIVDLNVTEETRQYSRQAYPRLNNDLTRVYPAFFTVVYKKPTAQPNQGIATREGNFILNRAKIPLWVDSKPTDFDDLIRDLFTAN